MLKLTVLGLLLIASILTVPDSVFGQESTTEGEASWQRPEDIDWELIRLYRQLFRKFNIYNVDAFGATTRSVGTAEDTALALRYARLTRPRVPNCSARDPESVWRRSRSWEAGHTGVKPANSTATAGTILPRPTERPR